MPAAACRRTAGLLVLLFLVTYMPVRVWLLGACPVCGGWHQPILVAYLGANPDDPTPYDTPGDDPPASPHHDDDRLTGGCHPPMPYGPTAAPPASMEVLASGDVTLESDFTSAPRPAFSLIRPPRA